MSVSRLRHLPFLLGLALVALAAVGLAADPADSAPAFEGMDVVLCLDVSRSMLARDVAPDRLRRAQAEIAALAAFARGDRLGLVLFAGEPRLLVPRTQDGASLAEMAALAGPWDVTRGGTDLPAALEAARVALQGRGGPGAIVVLSDGEDLGGRDAAAVIGALQSEGIAVHALGLGTRRGAKIPDGGAFVTDREGREVVSVLDPRTLARIADATGGTYRSAREGGLLDLYRDAILPAGRDVQARDARRGLGDAPAMLLALGLLVLLLDLAWRAPAVRRRPLAAALVLLAASALGGCERGGVDPEAHATFLRGNAAYADSLALEAAAADATAAERGDLMRAAYRRAEDALAAWQWAAATRLDWPQARRNVERGLLRMKALREHKKEGGKPDPKSVPFKGDQKPKDEPTKDKPEEDPPEQPEVPEDPPANPTARIDAGELPQERVLGVLETLRLRERQKIDLRKQRRTVRPALGGRDW